MQRPSYPKETPDQWPPTAGDHSEWGGACNQSINTGCSLGERYNLMRHTHTNPFIWLPPPFCLLPKLLSEPFLLVLFLPGSLSAEPCLLRLLCPPRLPSHLLPPPIDISKIPRGLDTQKQGMQLGWSGGRWRGRRWTQGRGSWGVRDRQIDGARTGWILVSDWAIVFTGLRSAALRSSDEAVSVLTIAWRVV